MEVRTSTTQTVIPNEKKEERKKMEKKERKKEKKEDKKNRAFSFFVTHAHAQKIIVNKRERRRVLPETEPQ